jgi:cytidylate kinase
MRTPLQIAIDGPVASGKGDIAARIAKRLSMTYIYTGAMYRALALACIQKKISCKDKKRVQLILKDTSISILPPNLHSKYPYTVYLGDEEVTERIQEEDTAKGASDVGVMPFVRRWMVACQKNMVVGKRVIMEGRDIGSRVLPDAQMKIYLTADVIIRARRRFLQYKFKGNSRTLEQTLKDTKARDLQDISRLIDPLQKLPDAWEIDTTNLTQEEVVKIICAELQKRKLI